MRTFTLFELTLAVLLPFGLIPSLGDRTFKRREAAHIALGRLGEAARPALDAAAGHPDPEVQRRAQLLQRPEWVEQIADDKSRRILPRRFPRLPWIDMNVVGEGAFTHYLLAAKTPTTGQPDWPEYREATRLYVRGLILQKRPRREILDTLDQLAEVEVAWIRANGKAYTPPLELPKGVR